jgi:pimeloyl-ACP methyl ester carboxylesterase
MGGVGLSSGSRIRRAYLDSGDAVGEAVGAPRPERSLVLWGAQDRLLPPRYGEKVVTALGRCADPATVEMITFPGLGSALPQKAPALVSSSLREFLRAS